MKRLILIPLLLITTVHAQLTWQQTAGITCLAGAGLVAVTHPKTVYDGAVKTKKYVQGNPGKIMIGLTTLGVAFLANRDVVNDLSNVASLAQRIKKLLTIK